MLVKGRKIYQTSEHRLTAILLAVIGGYLDAYSYICRGGVFANAQTGNIVLMGVSAAQFDIRGVLHYIYPIVAFALGILICEYTKEKCKKMRIIHWRQIVIVIELISVIAVAFIPIGGVSNHIANVIISFVCALQVEAFRKVKGTPFASTMCTGNLRSATERIYKYKSTKDKKLIKEAMEYYVVICSFIIGAGIGAFATDKVGAFSVIIVAAVLGIVLMLMQNEFMKSKW